MYISKVYVTTFHLKQNLRCAFKTTYRHRIHTVASWYVHLNIVCTFLNDMGAAHNYKYSVHILVNLSYLSQKKFQAK